MALACQLIKPLCFTMGLEKHTGLGMFPFPPVPFTPNPFINWLSLGTSCLTPLGDWKSPDVFGDDCAFVKRGSDTKYFRPHISLSGPPLPSLVPPVIDMGLILMHVGFGSSKTVWGPFSVKANITAKDEAPAVLFAPAPGAFVGLLNHTVCHYVARMPSVLDIQVPNSVFAGMTGGDVAGSLVLAGTDMLLDAVLGKFAGKALGGLNKAISKRLAPMLAKSKMKGVTRALFQSTVDHKGNWDSVLGQLVDKVTGGTLTDTLANGLGIPVVGQFGSGGPRATLGLGDLNKKLADWVASAL